MEIHVASPSGRATVCSFGSQTHGFSGGSNSSPPGRRLRNSTARRPHTSSEISSRAAQSSTSAPDQDPEINVLYDSGPTSSPMGKAEPHHSLIVKLSTSILDMVGSAAPRWDPDRLHRFTRKGGEISKLAMKPNRSSTLPANIEQTALTSREDAYRLLKANQ